MKRGLFIVFEGIDRSGKSTQCNMLTNYFDINNISYLFIHFPDRSTPIGQIIHTYLQTSIPQSSNLYLDQILLLLFSANKWERVSDILHALDNGIHVICDRYLYSAWAYGYANQFSISHCQQIDINLPRPDIVFFLQISTCITSQVFF